MHRGENSGAGVEAGADDEGETETGAVGGVEVLESGEFLGAEPAEAGGGLFAGGLGGELVLLCEAAGEIGVRADEGELALGIGGV